MGVAALNDRFARRRESATTRRDFERAAVLEAHECLKEMDVALSLLAGAVIAQRERDTQAYAALTRLSASRFRIFDAHLRGTLEDVTQKSERARAAFKKGDVLEMREALSRYNSATSAAHQEIGECLERLTSAG